MAEHDAAYSDYRTELDVNTAPLGSEPRLPRPVDWEAWRRAKERYDAADAAVLRFLRGEDE